MEIFPFKVELALYQYEEVNDAEDSVHIQVAVSNPSLADKLGIELNNMLTLFKGDHRLPSYNTKLSRRIAAEFEFNDIHVFFLQLCATASSDWRKYNIPKTKKYFEQEKGPMESDFSWTSSEEESACSRTQAEFQHK